MGNEFVVVELFDGVACKDTLADYSLGLSLSSHGHHQRESRSALSL